MTTSSGIRDLLFGTLTAGVSDRLQLGASFRAVYTLLPILAADLWSQLITIQETSLDTRNSEWVPALDHEFRVCGRQLVPNSNNGVGGELTVILTEIFRKVFHLC